LPRDFYCVNFTPTRGVFRAKARAIGWRFGKTKSQIALDNIVVRV
jgi:hypothetical protein